MMKLADKRRTSKKGFTLIELSFSLVFIAILSIIIVVIINDAISSYRRGITLNQINSVGMELNDDFRSVIQNSPSEPVKNECEKNYSVKSGSTQPYSQCVKDGAKNFISLTRFASVKIKDKNENMPDMPVYGAFCTGSYSYVWNSGYLFNDDYKIENGNFAKAKLQYKNDKTVENFKLIKVRDETRTVCISAVNSNPGLTTDKYAIEDVGNIFKIEDATLDDIETVLPDDGSLALYDLSVEVPASNAAENELFYSVSFILGTIQSGININVAGGFCAPPAEYGNSYFDYCAINKFNIAVRATGG